MRRNARQRAETNWAKDAILSGFEARVKEAIRAKQTHKQSKHAEVSP
jgi:hypothetical protein